MRLDADGAERPVRLVLLAGETPTTVNAVLNAASEWQSQDGHGPVRVEMDGQTYLLETRESDSDVHRA